MGGVVNYVHKYFTKIERNVQTRFLESMGVQEKEAHQL